MVLVLRGLQALPGAALTGSPADEQDAGPGLHPALEPLAWIVGRWEGVGALVYPTVEDRTYVQELSFTHDGRPFLQYSSRSWLLDDDGRRGRPSASEAAARQ